MTTDDPTTDPLDGPIDDPVLAARLAAGAPVDDLARRRAIAAALAVYDEIHPATEAHRPAVGATRWMSVAAAVLLVGAAGVVVATRLGGDGDSATISEEPTLMIAAPEAALDDVPADTTGDAPTGAAPAGPAAAPVESAAVPDAAGGSADTDRASDDADSATTDPGADPGPDAGDETGNSPGGDTGNDPVGGPSPAAPDGLARVSSPDELGAFAAGRPPQRTLAPDCAPPGAAVLGQILYREQPAYVIALEESVQAIDAETCAVLAVAP